MSAGKIGAIKIVQSANKITNGSVIFFHGSGDTGAGILEWVKFLVNDFALPNIKFSFPTAPLRPYTPLQGELSNVWFDRLNITPYAEEHEETLNSISMEVKNIIDQEVKSGIPLNKIIVGGFSMGGALALQLAYRYIKGLGGAFALSSFLNENSAVYEALKNNKSPEVRHPPLYMCHGDRDSMVPLMWGEETYKNLTSLGIVGEFMPIKNCMHELKKSELKGLLNWIDKIMNGNT